MRSREERKDGEYPISNTQIQGPNFASLSLGVRDFNPVFGPQFRAPVGNWIFLVEYWIFASWRKKY